MTIRDKLLKDIEAFLSLSELTATQFGIDALKNGNFVLRLRQGTLDPRLSTTQRIYDFMKEWRG